MGLGDSIRRFFARRSNPALEHLELFARSHEGVEGFVEPRTTTNPTTLLLVDRIGEHIRGPVRDPQEADAFCDRLGIPVYDAAVIGYPQRMKDFQKGRRPDSASVDEQFAEIERRLQEPGRDTLD